MSSHKPSLRLRLGIVAGAVTFFAATTLLWQALAAPVERDGKLAKPHETTLNMGAEFHAGSQAAVVLDVHSVRTLTDLVPLPGSDITIQLKDKAGKTHELYKGKTGAKGLANAEFKVPDLEAGQYTLEVITKSTLGEEKIVKQVRVHADAKILLVSDKPLYQPGQLMHLRALVLRPFDMRPIENKDLLFEVEDPKGNKLFKKTLRTSEFGIASLDFQLADEVNMGDYHIRAMLGEVRSEKTVQVKRYVLPKFKVEVKADKRFYLPKETVKVELQSDYFFGKPVANAKIEVTASTFDVAFRKFHTWKGETDAVGHAKFDVQLPDYFVGQPLQKGSALVKLDVKLLDSADHSETVTKTYTVSDQPIRISLIPEGGRIVPEMDNRIFVSANYPDGTPAPNCDVQLWHITAPVPVPVNPGAGGRPRPPIPENIVPAVNLEEKAKAALRSAPIAKAKTNAAGLAEFTIKPKAEQLRVGEHGPRDVEMLGGKQQQFGPKIMLDLVAVAKDAKGNTAQTTAELNSQPTGENVLLRLDKAIYQTGDRVDIDVRTSAGMPTVFVDVVRGGQIMLSRWLDVKEGKASQKLDLPQTVFGSLEIHAYQMLQSGEIIRDSRVVYVQPRNDLKVEVKADKTEHAPGEDGRIRFTVTDSAGKPTAAALGVIIVDEAVYALQDLQPGLEKVYFTLQEELLKPQAQIKFGPGDTIDHIVLEKAPPAPRQQVAEVLLTSIKLAPPGRIVVDPVRERRQHIASQMQQIGGGLFNAVFHNQVKDALVVDKKTGRWTFRDGLLNEVVKAGHVQEGMLTNVFGGKLTLDDLANLEKDFTPENLGQAITGQRMQQVLGGIAQYTNQHRAKFYIKDRWQFPASILDDSAKATGIDKRWLVDAWGEPLRLAKSATKLDNQSGQPQFDYHELVSAGPDRKLGTKDDVWQTKVSKFTQVGWAGGMWWNYEQLKEQAKNGNEWGMRGAMLRRNLAVPQAEGALMFFANGLPAPGPAGGRGIPAPKAAVADNLRVEKTDAAPIVPTNKAVSAGGGEAPVTRVREYFPETMLWQPALITDDNGVADLSVSFADSITTWRLSASANSRAGALGSATSSLKVFQDFFVDIDLPVSLTQGDEVAFPVAVYNYLKTPQTVRIELQNEPWFELLDQGGLSRKLDLEPGEVTSVKFRVKANTIGNQPLLVKAFGSAKSDAVKRVVEVVPNGQRFEKVVTDRLNGKVNQAIDLPANAIADASKLFVRIYPGVMAQVVEGLDGMLQMPSGCFEQTSSAAYPNILIVDYIKKNKVASPQVLLKAEQYLNLGYQRLLTFERPGGGFDWWGREEPLVWLSAYGLQEFSDMAKVYPVDRGIIDRTQAFLMRKRDKDGTWSAIGATHGETIERMGNPKLLLTSYVTWSLLDSGYPKEQLKDTVKYIRDNLGAAGDNAYILALAANALASYDPKDDSTLEALKRLEKLRKEIPEWKAANFPGAGTTLTYARGDSMTVETTALAAIAMHRTGQYTNSVNQALTYLVKAKAGNGTWGSTQATILALKALLAGMGGQAPKEPVHFTVKVNGKEQARGKVDAENADLMQAFEIKGINPAGANQVEIDLAGETNLMYQIVGRHFEPWKEKLTPKKPLIDLDVSYDRTKLSTNDLLRAKATLKYNGEAPTYMVMLDLGIAPGFTVDAGDFAEMVDKGRIKKFSLTSRQVIVYLGDVKPGDVLTFEYSLRPRYPLRARTAPSVAYEYNTPAVRSEAQPVDLVVEEKK